MGYRKLGFVIEPKSKYILDMALNIHDEMGDTFDQDIADAIKSLGKENVRLSNFFFERLLTLKSDKLDSKNLRNPFMLLLASFLKEIGTIDTEPVIVDYVTDPAVTIDEAVYRMLAARIPKFTADMLGGQYATVDTLTYFFPEVIRKYALVVEEAPLMLRRLRQWIGHLGYRLIHGEQLSQAEMTAFVMYSSTQEGSLGYSEIIENERIVPAEMNDLLVNEAAELYKASTLPGPFLSHSRLLSDAKLQRLTFYFGPQVPELRMCTGIEKPYGPYSLLSLTPHDSLTWSPEGHIAGMTARTSLLASTPGFAGAFAIRIPNMKANRNDFGIAGAFPDDPSFRIILTDEDDCANYEWERNSEWRGIRMNSRVHAASMELALADMALQGPAQGACQVENVTLENIGLCSFTDAAKKKVTVDANNKINEQYLLPVNGKLAMVETDMAGHYARLGTVRALPALSEFLEVETKWFLQPQPRIVEYVAAMNALPMDEKQRFEDVISLYHNVARFEKITGRKAPIDAELLARALLNMPA